MKVEELIGSLQTFEMAFSDKSEKKKKSIDFVFNTSDEQTQGDLETDEVMSDAMVLLG